MKKAKIGLIAFALVALGFGVFAAQNRRYMTPAQETAIFSLANRYIEAACRRPNDIAEIFEGSVIPSSLLNKSKDFLSEQLMVEGECFGRPLAEIQDDISHQIGKMPRDLITMQMTSDLAVSDFLDCLVEVERSFYSLQIATRKIFTCIDRHLDVRGFWYEMIEEIKPHQTSGSNIDPYIPPVPPSHMTPYDQCMTDCYQRFGMDSSNMIFVCQNDCLREHYDDLTVIPTPPTLASPIPVYDLQPMPVEPLTENQPQ